MVTNKYLDTEESFRVFATNKKKEKKERKKKTPMFHTATLWYFHTIWIPDQQQSAIHHECYLFPLQKGLPAIPTADNHATP